MSEGTGLSVNPTVVEHVLTQAALARGTPSSQARLVVERGLRDRAEGVRDVLAAAAFPGATWCSLNEFLNQAEPQATAGLSGTLAPWWAALGRMTVLHATSTEELGVAAKLFDIARLLDPDRPFDRDDYLAAVQAYWDTDQFERIRDLPRRRNTLFRGEEHFIDLNMISRSRPLDEWVSELNRRIFTPGGLAGVGVDPNAENRFDGLFTSGVPGSVEGPLVTVVLTTFRRGSSLLTAVNSVLRQTWTNLEVLIVDDCSGEAYEDVLDRAANLDPRVTVLRQETNQGTYAARNRALEVATGDFVTFQDDDDWSHSQRVERQVGPMLADTDIHSTLSYAVQADDALSFRYASRRTRLMNSSSLMFRRRDLSTVGGFDQVRKGADTELIRRLRVALPGHQELVDSTLAFVRLTGDSLSRDDFRPSWNHPSRSEYAEAAEWWHQKITRGASANLSPTRRPFPAPQRISGVTEALLLDVLIVGDFASEGWPWTAAGELLRAAFARGVSVGILSVDSPLRLETPGRTRISPGIRALIDTGKVQRVFVDQAVQARQLVITDASLLQFTQQVRWSVAADECLVVSEEAPVESGGTGTWSAGDVVLTLSRILPHVRPVKWKVESPGTAVTLAQKGASVVAGMSALTRPPLFKASLRRTRMPVVGRVGSDDPLHWPLDREALLGAYPDSDHVDVRVLGSVSPVEATLGQAPPSWLRFKEGDLPAPHFLRMLDFYVHSSEQAPSLPHLRAMSQAMAAGCVVLIDSRHKGICGDAAIYCEASDALAVITSTWLDPRLYRQQQKRARRWLERQALTDANAQWSLLLGWESA